MIQICRERKRMKLFMGNNQIKINKKKKEGDAIRRSDISCLE